MKILVIDDEPAVLTMYRQALEGDEQTVITAPNGETGIKLAKDEHPDLILLDIIMPAQNGFDVLTELKKHDETREIPVYMLTNLPEEASGEKAKELGAVGYLMKAKVEPRDLANLIRSIKN